MTYRLGIHRFDSGFNVDFDIDFDELDDAIRSCKGIWDMLTPEAKNAFIDRTDDANRIVVCTGCCEVLYNPCKDVQKEV